MVCNRYDEVAHVLRQYANDKRRKDDVRQLLKIAADALADCNRELKDSQRENDWIKKKVAAVFAGIGEIKDAVEE